MNKPDECFEYRGTEPFRIVPSMDLDSRTSQLEQLLFALRAGDADAVFAAVHLLFLARAIKKGLDSTQLVTLLESLIEKLNRNETVAGEIRCALAWLGVDLLNTRSEVVVGKLAAAEFASAVLETLIPIAISDFYITARTAWAEIEPYLICDYAMCSSCDAKTSFQNLGDWVSRVDTPESWYLLMKWLRHVSPWVRDHSAWFLRRWWSPTLAGALCDALVMGENDPNASDHTFFLLLRLTQMADPSVLPKLESLIGTLFDRAILPPGEPPPSVQPSNMLREAIVACGGSIK